METVAEAVRYFECRIPEMDLRVRINLHVMERMTLDVMEGFKKVPKRGLEVGGLLLGRVEQGCTIVDDYEALDSEHQRGPSFLLSEKDRRLLGDAVARWSSGGDQRVVGLYRSHTRPGLAAGDEDAALLKEHCPAPPAVLLLVKPEAGRRCTAALYAAGDGLHAKPPEFPFHRDGLAAGGYTVVEAPGPAAAPVPQPESARPEAARVEPAPRLRGAKLLEAMTQQLERAQESRPREVLLAPPHPRVRRRQWAIAAGMCVVLCGGVAGYGAARWWTRAPAASLMPSPKSLALSVTWGSGALHLRWDRNVEWIRNASRGVLGIADGHQRHRLELTAQELAQGSIQYWPSSQDVSFKLEVYTAQDSASESVRAVGIPLPEPPAPKPVKRDAPVQKSLAPEAAPHAPNNPPFTRVRMEVLKDSAWNRLWGKSPITTPPRLLHSVIPSAPLAVRRQVKDPVIVDVRLALDAAGKVKRSGLVRRSDGPEPLASLALGASSRWSFAPARSGERRVGSEVVLHYRFGEPVLAEARLR